MKSNKVRKLMKIDAEKVFNLLKSSDSRSIINFCDLIRLCANLGEIKLIEEIINYTKFKNILLPNDEITELILFSYFHNGELEKVLDIGFLILKRNDLLLSQILDNNNNQNQNYVDDNEENYDDEFHGDLKKVKRLEYLVLRENVKILIEKPFFQSKNFYTILFAACGALGRPTDCLELYEYLERDKKILENKSIKEKTQEIMFSLNERKERINEILIQEKFYHNIEFFVIESFLKRNQLEDAQFWALQAVSSKLKRIIQNSHVYQLSIKDDISTNFDDINHNNNNKSNRDKKDVGGSNNNNNNKDNDNSNLISNNNKNDRNDRNDNCMIEINNSHYITDDQDEKSHELFVPILKVCLQNGQIDDMKNLLTECNDLDRTIGHKLNHTTLLRLSAEGHMSEVMEILTLNNLDANIRLIDKLSLWEAALLGCLYSSYETLIEKEKILRVEGCRSYSYNENSNNDNNDNNSNDFNYNNSNSSSNDDEGQGQGQGEGQGQNLGSRSPAPKNKRLSPSSKAEQVTTPLHSLLPLLLLFLLLLLCVFSFCLFLLSFCLSFPSFPSFFSFLLSVFSFYLFIFLFLLSFISYFRIFALSMSFVHIPYLFLFTSLFSLFFSLILISIILFIS